MICDVKTSTIIRRTYCGSFSHCRFTGRKPELHRTRVHATNPESLFVRFCDRASERTRLEFENADLSVVPPRICNECVSARKNAPPRRRLTHSDIDRRGRIIVESVHIIKILHWTCTLHSVINILINCNVNILTIF